MRFYEDNLDTLRCSDGIQRMIHIWQAADTKAVIVAVHGAMAHGGDYVTPAQFFKPHGYTTLSFDMHGHDLKRKAHVPRFAIFLDDLDVMLAWTKDQYPDLPIFLMGHSMGGLILTHYGLQRVGNDPLIKGFIISSPWYVNAVQVPAALEKTAGILANVVPRMKVPAEDIRPFLTHDNEIRQRHDKDEADHIRASAVTMRFANECLKAQRWIPDHIQQWSHPMFTVVAGNDKLADSIATQALLDNINQTLLTRHYYADNYHENFNELNRDEIFADILSWMEKRLQYPS